ncbi:hypothetical protein ACQZ6F_29220 [Rhizobium sp. A22-96]
MLRELNVLATGDELLVIAKRDPRSLRSHFDLTATARAMLDTFDR